VPIVVVSKIEREQLRFSAIYASGTVTLDAGSCPLRVTPCATVEADRRLQVYDRVAERFPEASFLKEHRAHAYCGVPSLDAAGRVIAVTCLLDDRARAFSAEEQELMALFAERIGGELQRFEQQEVRQAAERALIAAEQRLNAVLTIAPEAIIVADAAMRIKLFNSNAATIFGYAPQELIGEPLTMLMPERFRGEHGNHAQAFGRSCEASRLMGTRGRIVGLRKNGEEFPAEASITSLSTNGESLYTAILRDVT